MIFLIEYDRPNGKIIKMVSFHSVDRGKAENLRLKVELKLNRNSIEHEVVLLEAANETALRRTHRRYFQDPSQIGGSIGSSPI